MNPDFQSILDKIQKIDHLAVEEKQAFIEAIKDSDKSQTMLQFKLERLEKDKHTLEIMLEESIEDLQKKSRAVEAQNRELEIESSLEKVRTVAMGMRKRDDMLDICRIISEQLQSLGIKEIRNVQTAIFYKDKGTYINYEYYRLHDKALVTEVDYTNDEISVEFAAQMIKGADEVFVRGLKGQQVQDWLTIQKTTNVFIDANLENATSLTYYWFSLGPVAIGTSTYHPLSEEEIVLFKRFRNVFDLAYRRYLDIEKAEAQAREAQIQLALERVRARTMAMHKSDELAEVAILLFQQVSDLGIKTWTTGFNIWSDDNNSYEDWITNPQGGFMPPYTIDASKLPVSTKVSNAKKRGDEFLVNYEEGESLAETYRQLGKFGEKQFKSIQESGFEFPSHQYEHFVFGSKVSLMFITYDAVPEAHDIFKRFGKVFEQTYTRFLDLQKAEEQAREARIEAALEKVRSRSLAMHRSDELQEVVHTVFEKLKELNVDFYTVIIVIFQEGSKDIIWWMENKVNQQYPKILVRYADNQYLEDLFEARENGRELLSKCYYGEEKNKLYNHLFQHTDLRHVADTQKKFLLENEFAAMSVAIARNTGIHITNYSKTSFSDEENETLKRFSKVFEQAYIRFMDLQKAEAQAREAQIEAALERVRARAMAMHKSEELNEVANEMRKQLRLLGQEELETCAIHLYDESPDYFQSWAALLSPNEHGEVVQIQSQFPKHGVKIIEEMLECYALRKGDYVLINEGAKAQQFLAMTKQKAPEVFEVVEESMKEQESNDKRAYWSVADFEGGSLVMTTMIEPDENSRILLRRFANVFGLAYRRFVDIKHAEAQAREAQIEAALERVRSRTLAMQRSDELAETASVLFKQLIHLGIEPNRLYINIVKDETGAAEFWITDEDGSQISMAYSENLNANPTFKRMFDGWKTQNRSLIIDMEGRELQEYFKYLSSINVPFKGGLSQKRRLQYIAYFNKGFIGMASPDEQPAETMQLLERFAAVFNLTFTRFNDLKIAEAHALQAEQDLIEIKAAKKKAEDTLIELQATQKQLIQSEKMASLGELTAGIAHEIQNPLNFVNNFSEVSNELIDEMKAELNKGDIDEAKFIADDIKQNLEKINHHGRRADAIVKGMLQHSRTSSGQKEPTDINVLTDEYLRLAYHGLRAKDKSFNADIKTDFDNNIGKINIIPQEIGRVILNLINNAFYAVDEKMKHTSTGSVQNGYEPTVSVSTKKNNEKVEIKVSDNGNGIPSSIKEKIFQPFFTTKPTGQGTGLGLSLAYDIITKGHGGEIKIETKEGEGSKFIIIIPSA